MMFCVDSKDCAKVQKIPLMAKHIFIFFASPGVYLSALSARFSAARDEGRQKQPSGGEKPRFFIGKRRKPQIPWTESSENGENCVSSTDDERKTANSAFHPWMTSGKREKLIIVGRRNTKNRKNCSSSADEMQNRPKTALPPGRKIKIIQKPRFRHGGKSKSLENRVSARAEKQNHPKTAFPPRRKIKIGKNRKVCAAILQADDPCDKTCSAPRGQDKAEDRPSALSITAQCAN